MNDNKLVIIEQNRFVPGKTKVDVFKIDDNGFKRKFFTGLVTLITNRGIVANPLGEEGGESLDILAGSFVPFKMFCEKFDIKVVKTTN